MSINKENFRALLLDSGFEREGMFDRYRKAFPAADAELVADFDAGTLSFPESKGLVVNSRTTCNFSQAENAVVFECVARLLDRGYLPRHLELEPSWKVGHGNKSGRADVLVKDNNSRAYLIIECKTAGAEFKKAWVLMEADGGQPLSYAQQEKSVQYVALYASHLDPDTGRVAPDLHLVRTHDNPPLLEQLRLAHPGQDLPTFAGANNAKEMYRAWAETYQRESARRGLFDADTPPFAVGKKNYALADLRDPGTADTEGKYHEFATILRQHNVAGRENAFDKLVNLFLCKIVDEQLNPNDLKFRWKGRAYDSDFDLQDRLQQLYSAGMKAMLREDVTYITNAQIDDAFRFVRHDPDATRDTIKKYFRELKFFTNNDFAFIDVHNEKLFELNAAVLRKLVELFQEMRVRTAEPNQFLGDLFEGFLDGGVKQSEGQFFTPIPVVRFLLYSLPLAELLAQHPGPLPAIDYACGAGHFLNELALELRALLPEADQELADAGLVGIEKEYRLSKVAKVSAFMYGQQHTEIVHGDGLAQHAKTPEGNFRVLVANPPYSVKGFLQTLPEAERLRYNIYAGLDKKTLGRNNAIETFFMERAAQLLAPGGVAAIVLPSSVLSNGSQYTAAREGLLQAFEIVGIAQLGSRTFGKTGTNTVTLFLRRRDKNPALADHYRNRVDAWFRPAADGGQAVYQDEHLFLAYCRHQEWDPTHYRTLLQGQPSAALLAYELFGDYRRAFEKLSEVKALPGKTWYKKLTADEQTQELARRWVEYLHAQERDKLYYYVLAAVGPVPHQPPRPVVLIKSPTDNKEQKQFLGYDWSGAKGNEGIQYLTGTAAPSPARPRSADEDTADAPDPDETPETLANQSKLATIQTTLYDPLDRANPAKLNTYIERNFRGEDIVVPEELAPYLSTARLVDMLDFKRVDFDKALSMSPEKQATIETIWPLETLDKYVDVIGGLWTGKKPPLQTVNVIRNTNFALDGKVNYSDVAQIEVEQGQFKNRQLLPGDIIVEKSGGSETQAVGRVVLFNVAEGDYSFSNFTARLRVASPDVLPAYLHTYLNFFYRLGYTFNLQNGASGLKNLDLNRYLSSKIPVPPAGVQAALVAACEAVDVEAAQVAAALAAARQQVGEAVQAMYEAGYPQKKLLAVADTNPSKAAIREVPDATLVSFVEMASVSNNGVIERAVLRPLGTLRKGSYTYFAENDVILAKITPCLENGKCALATGLTNGIGMGSTEFHVMRAHVDEVLPGYLFALLNRESIRVEAERHMTGSSGHRRAPITFYEGLSLPVPDLATQQSLLVTLTTLQTQITAAQATLAAAPSRKQALVRQHLQGAV